MAGDRRTWACRGYTTLTDFLRDVRPSAQSGFERRFETPPGKQAQADFAQFEVVFEDGPDQIRTIWLFSIILAHSRWLWGRFCANQNLQTAVIEENPQGMVTYNRSLVDLLNHYGAI